MEPAPLTDEMRTRYARAESGASGLPPRTEFGFRATPPGFRCAASGLLARAGAQAITRPRFALLLQMQTNFVTTQVLPFFSFPFKGKGLLWLF